jgi:hypothetical protein
MFMLLSLRKAPGFDISLSRYLNSGAGGAKPYNEFQRKQVTHVNG